MYKCPSVGNVEITLLHDYYLYLYLVYVLALTPVVHLIPCTLVLYIKFRHLFQLILGYN